MNYPEVSRRFKHILQLRNISAQELADKSKVGKSSISHYVNGSHCPSNHRAQILADVLMCNPLWLMGLDEEMIKTEKPAITDNDELQEVLDLFRSASPEIRAAALAVLKSPGPHS